MSRTLSPETESFLQSLYQVSSFWERPTKRRLTALAEIGRSRQPAAIPNIAPLLLEGNREVANAVAVAAGELFRLMPAGELPWLDLFMRESSPYRWRYPSAWAEVKPSGLKALEVLGEASVFAFGMAASHRNGFVREEAVRRLGEVRSGLELPFLLLRLSDWVVGIREAAYILVRERLTEGYGKFFVANMVLLERLRLARTGVLVQLVEETEQFLRSGAGRDALVAGLTSQDLTIRRSCYRIALKTDLAAGRPLLEQALADADLLIRLWAVEKLSSDLDPESANQILSRLRDDRLARVRGRALSISVQRFRDDSGHCLEQALMDADPAVRGFAQFHVHKTSADFRRFYSEALAKSERAGLYAAISGLGEVGVASDSVTVEQYVRHPTPRIRRAALRALARLSPNQYLDIFETGLSDLSPSVSIEAKLGLVKTLPLVAGERIWGVFVVARERHVRRNSLFLLARLSKWESIVYLVEALVSGGEDSETATRDYIRRWYARVNRTFPTPTRLHIERLTAAQARSAPGEARMIQGLIQLATTAM